MKLNFFAALASAVIVTAGCTSTVSDTHSPAITWSRDNISQRYERNVDQVYKASVAVITSNGVLLTEYIPHGTNAGPNTVRSLAGKVTPEKRLDPRRSNWTPTSRSPKSPCRSAPHGASATLPWPPNW